MLHFENRQGGKKGGHSLKALLPLLLLLLTGCDNHAHKDRHITMEAFSDMKSPAFIFDVQDIQKQLNAWNKGDTVKHLLWVDRFGVDQRADSLLSYLQQVSEIGFSEQAFNVKAIENDLRRMKTLDFDDGNNKASMVAARLEHNLTKACLSYCRGQRFGFINPNRLFNHLDIEKQDTARKYTKYRGLFDVSMDLPTEQYTAEVKNKIKNDSIVNYLREIQPRDPFYNRLKSMLTQATDSVQRKRIIVNMERCRWRSHQPLTDTGKRIVVNIPAYHLYAYSPNETLDMRVVCGAIGTKTPQLTSNIEYMEVNPKWVIPKSIIDNEVARRAGDSAYFARNRYDIVDKTTNQTLDARNVSRQQLLSGKYRVAQKGGAGHSLGRIVFRFKNDFSVYLHDTSTPSAFQRDSRALSHGCVRVAQPFELARFVLDTPDEWLLDRIRIAMGQSPETEQGMQWISSHPDQEARNKIIGYVPVTPRVPLYIIYYTLWPDENGILQTWPDVYGYDRVMWNQLKTFT